MVGAVAFLVLLFFIVVVFVTLYNVFALEVKGVKAVPFAVPVLTFLSKVPGLKGTSLGNTLHDLANPTYKNTLNNETNHVG